MKIQKRNTEHEIVYQASTTSTTTRARLPEVVGFKGPAYFTTKPTNNGEESAARGGEVPEARQSEDRL